MVVTVTDVNDYSPSCTLGAYVYDHPEDVTISSTVIVDISNDCSDDDDSSPNNDLMYDIQGVNGVNGDDGIFQLGASNGQLEFASQPNFESASEHIVVITVC